MSELTQTGALLTGVVVLGVTHKAFSLRLPTVLDNIEAVDEVGSTNGVALNAAILSRQITRLGTLEPKAINYELVIGMHPSDFNLLEEAASELEKKRLAAALQEPVGSASD